MRRQLRHAHRDFCWIAAERGDVFLDPLQREEFLSHQTYGDFTATETYDL